MVRSFARSQTVECSTCRGADEETNSAIPLTDGGTSTGEIESVSTDEENGEVILSVRLDPDRAGVDFRDGGAILEKPLSLSPEVERDLLYALDPRTPTVSE